MASLPAKMLNQPVFRVTPDDDALEERGNWKKVGKDQYAAVRLHLHIVPRRGREVRGPAEVVQEFPEGTKVVTQRKRVVTEVFTEQITETVESAVSTKVTTELTSTLGSSVGLDGAKLTASITSSLQSKLGTEIAESVRRSVSRVTTYSLTVQEEQSRSSEMSVPGPGAGTRSNRVSYYPLLTPHYWDVYLTGVDYLTVTHTTGLFRDSRKEADEVSVAVNIPLFCVQFYVPNDELSVAVDDFTPDVDYPTEVEILPLDAPASTRRVAPPATPMRKLAAVAFPASRQEKRQAKERRKTKTAAKKAGARKSSAKKGGARKTVMKGGARKSAPRFGGGGVAKKAPVGVAKKGGVAVKKGPAVTGKRVHGVTTKTSGTTTAKKSSPASTAKRVASSRSGPSRSTASRAGATKSISARRPGAGRPGGRMR